jgi:hypothetical protein
MTIHSNQIKVYSICYYIIQQEQVPLLKLLFVEYCKSKLTDKQYILLLMMVHLMSKNNISNDPLYEFMKQHIQQHKYTITKQLLNV